MQRNQNFENATQRRDGIGQQKITKLQRNQCKQTPNKDHLPSKDQTDATGCLQAVPGKGFWKGSPQITKKGLRKGFRERMPGKGEYVISD